MSFLKDKRSFVTGSQAYGTPTKSSDIDVVVYLSVDDMERLAKANELDFGKVVTDYGEGVGSACLQFGKLNLICVSSEQSFEIWRKGTEDLIKRKPVTREEAVNHFTILRLKSL